MQHQPLDRSRNEIRLLKIVQDDHDDPVQYTVEHVSLIDVPTYFALSYTWGDPKVTREILSNGEGFQATTNLYAALLRLRRMKYTVLWVDTVYINQEDMEEKSQQLLLMGAIYRKAELTVAWLGEESGSSPRAFQVIHHLAEEQSTPMISPGDGAQKKNVSYPDRDPEDCLAIIKLLGRPYWRRIWIIQELALSREVMLLCGSAKIFFWAMERMILHVDLARVSLLHNYPG
jgi:hypothetical protein